MKANNMTISLPGRCKKKCPYCVSDMTFPVMDNPYLFRANLDKAINLADRIGVTHLLITGKGEPFDNLLDLKHVLESSKRFYIEIQTHLKDFSYVQLNYLPFMDVIAISIDHPKQFDLDHWKELTGHQWIIRAAIVLSDNFSGWDLSSFVNVCKDLGIRQLTIRQPTVPKYVQDTKEAKKTVNWIKKHTNQLQYQMILDELDNMARRGAANWLRDLQFGADLWDVDGVSFTAMRYCVESNNGEHIRSLIYQADGHLYTTWDSPGSILW